MSLLQKIELKDELPKPICSCWNSDDESDPGNPDCGCGEELDVVEWRWAEPTGSRVQLSDDRKQVICHPFYSSGTAIAKGDVGMVHNTQYYWEIKIQTEPYGTDVMVGLGVGTMNIEESAYDYKSFLGNDSDSYGLSYSGAICHNATVTGDSAGFCKGTVVGVRVDMFMGSLEFYLNREPQGVSFNDLKRHDTLYPMICSTAAQTVMRLTYASSWSESLLVRAGKILASSVSYIELPPGLAYTMINQFWMTLPSGGDCEDEAQLAATIKRKYWRRRID